jgi:hypothetical protein
MDTNKILPACITVNRDELTSMVNAQTTVLLRVRALSWAARAVSGDQGNISEEQEQALTLIEISEETGSESVESPNAWYDYVLEGH